MRLMNICFPGIASPERFVRRTKLVYPSMPSGLDGLRIAFATDLHVSRMYPRHAAERLIQVIASLNPDIVLWGGDYAESKEDTFALFAMAKSLHPPLGMYGAVGNNDAENFEGRTKDLQKAARDAGITLLVNKSFAIDVAGGRLIIAACDDRKHGHPSPRSLRGTQQSGDFTVFLSHSPYSVDPALEGVQRPPDLILAGHTHGGQFAAGRLTVYSLPYERKLRKDSQYFHVTGLHETGFGKMLVSNGIGTSRFPLRIGASPELHLITLAKKGSPQVS